VKILVILLALVSVAHADELSVEKRKATPRNTISIPLTALPLHGATVEVERDLPNRHLSIVAALGVRSTAGGDYDSRTLGVGGEVRYWILRRAIWTARPRGSAVGWYVAARVDAGRTTLQMDGEELGAVDTLSVGAFTGYRFAPWKGLEVRPYLGAAMRHESNTGPSWTRPGLAYGLAVGWQF
jgi:hypothetical protein